MFGEAAYDLFVGCPVDGLNSIVRPRVFGLEVREVFWESGCLSDFVFEVGVDCFVVENKGGFREWCSRDDRSGKVVRLVWNLAASVSAS